MTELNKEQKSWVYSILAGLIFTCIMTGVWMVGWSNFWGYEQVTETIWVEYPRIVVLGRMFVAATLTFILIVLVVVVVKQIVMDW